MGVQGTGEHLAQLGGPPEVGIWTIDTVHSFVTFSVVHFRVAVARGMAAGPSGTISIAPNLMDCSVEARIDASTVTTANSARDSKILGPDVLDVTRFPTIDFVSTGLSASGDHRYQLNGRLTMHGETKEVTLDLVVNGVIVDVWGKRRLGVTATTEFSRDDFGAGEWGRVPLAVGGFMVPSRVEATLDVEATREGDTS